MQSEQPVAVKSKPKLDRKYEKSVLHEIILQHDWATLELGLYPNYKVSETTSMFVDRIRQLEGMESAPRESLIIDEPILRRRSTNISPTISPKALGSPIITSKSISATENVRLTFFIY
jgi:hypothetical protein